jgi:hypothetical protein
MRARRLLLLAALTIAPLAAACVASPTAPDDSSTPTAIDSTRRREQAPWG